MTQKPSIGRIVHYELTEQDAKWINRSRVGREGLNRGNPVAAGMVFPMVIVRVFAGPDGPLVNGQVWLDGPDTYWATSRRERTDDDTAGRWFWPPRV